jgi:hypothetical protein
MTSRHCLRLKAAGLGIGLTGLQPAGLRILAVLDALAATYARDVVVTSAMRGDAGGHGRGEAIDVSVQGWPAWQILAAYQFLRVRLGTDFTVLYEVPSRSTGELAEIEYVSSSATAPHFHLQLKKGFGPWPPHTAATD